MTARIQPIEVDAEFLDDFSWTLAEIAGQLRDPRDAEATWLADLFDHISDRAYEHSIRNLDLQPAASPRESLAAAP